MNLSRLNLNLLPGLHALLDTRSVSKAAQKMCVTQSAMSRTLSHLREALNDPILIRKGNRIFLSEKAINIRHEVNRVVFEAGSIFENQQFDIATTQKHFRFAANHSFLQQVMPDILGRLWRQAPGLSFELKTLSPALDMVSGNVDLSIEHAKTTRDGFCYRQITEDRYQIVMCDTHPLTKESVSQENLSCFSLIISGNHGQLSDSAPCLLSTESGCQVKAYVPDLTIGRSLIQNSSLILVSPASDLTVFRALNGFTVKELPVNIKATSLNMVWPDYWETNRAHRWVRDFVRDELKALFSRDSSS